MPDYIGRAIIESANSVRVCIVGKMKGLQAGSMFSKLRYPTLALSSLLTLPVLSQAQFHDTFDQPEIEGWFWFTGDGDAEMDFVQKDGFARLQVDATKDRFNVWWAIIKRDISAYVDLEKLADPAYELRIEARVRPSHAPRRVNFMINTQRTTEFHEHLLEYDLGSTEAWHLISMTTRNLDVVPGDNLFVQLVLTDAGLEEYYVDVDYYRADVVRADETGPDSGPPIVYHPPVPPLESFSHHLKVAEDAVINAQFHEVNFKDWHAVGPEGPVPVLSLNNSQWAVLRWDFSDLEGGSSKGTGVLELTTHSIFNGGYYIEAYGQDLGEELYGKVRVIEILSGDTQWTRDTVTYDTLLLGKPYTQVFNSQMTMDVPLNPESGGKTLIPINPAVMQRLLDGTTKGFLLRPLGAILPSFHASGGNPEHAPKLHMNVAP